MLKNHKFKKLKMKLLINKTKNKKTMFIQNQVNKKKRVKKIILRKFNLVLEMKNYTRIKTFYIRLIFKNDDIKKLIKNKTN